MRCAGGRLSPTTDAHCAFRGNAPTARKANPKTIKLLSPFLHFYTAKIYTAVAQERDPPAQRTTFQLQSQRTRRGGRGRCRAKTEFSAPAAHPWPQSRIRDFAAVAFCGCAYAPPPIPRRHPCGNPQRPVTNAAPCADAKCGIHESVRSAQCATWVGLRV